MTQPLAPPHNIKGACTALVTPMNDDGVDEAAFVALVRWQIDEGIHGLVPCGTTGESPTLSHDEHRHVIELCVREVAGRVPVIAGCGSNSTDEAIDLVRHAEKVGADAALVVTPYYNKPSQRGLYEHFAAVARASSLPLIIYNIPGRCVVDMSVATMMRLATDFPTIVGVKDSSCDLMRPLLYRIIQLRASMISFSCPARMARLWRSWLRGVWGVFRWHPMLRRLCVPRCLSCGGRGMCAKRCFSMSICVSCMRRYF